MTTTTRLVSNVLVICLSSVLAFSSCTDSEQQAQIERRERLDKQEAQDRADAERRAAQTQAATQQATPEPEQTPEAPPEPEKVDNYMFHNTVCQCHEKTECGVTFWSCTDGKVYGCMHDVVYSIVPVDKTDDNSGNCN